MNCTMRIIRLRELYYACSTIFFREVRCKTGRVVREADPYGGVTRGAVRCRRAGRGVRPYGEGCKKCLCAGRCGHRPLRRALHEVRRGGASGTPPPTEALLMVRWGGAMWASPPTESYHGVRRGGALLPTVVPTDSRALSCPPIGALPRNRLASSATGGASPISPPAGDRKGRPYGSVTRGAMGGRPQGSPLRRLFEIFRWEVRVL